MVARAGMDRLTGAVAVTLVAITPASAHPHVWIDGGVDFVLGEGAVLEALEVTWRYDAFETLYILSSHGLGLNDEGALDEDDRQELVRHRSNWPEDFDGSAHLSVDGARVGLEWPEGLDAHIVDGRLEVTFTRRLGTPLPVARRNVDVAFYESTYFFAFSVTDPPRVSGEAGTCDARVIPFEPDGRAADLQDILFELGREETPDIENVGALFADRIELRCD